MATELVGIELKLMGAQGVFEDMEKLDAMVRQLGGRHKIEFELGQAKQKVLELTGEINATTRAIDKTREKIRALVAILKDMDEGDENFEEMQEAVKRANNQLAEHERHLKEVRAELKDTRQEVNELTNALKRVKPLGQVFSDWSLRIARFGSALQSAGNALTRFSAPFRMLMGGAVMGAGYKMLGKVTEGLESGFSRYDTMKKYTRLMAEYSTETYSAEQSVQDLDKSVLGLPIALDDAVSLAQRYTLSLGDMKRGTQLAIATNNAFLASMATENQRYQGMLQMQDLLNGKKLNSREWMSLGASMGKAINEIGKEFGYTNENMGEFRQELYSGNISTKEFLDALQKVGTGGGSLVKLAEQSKNTWEAFFSRIGTAFSRVGYNVLLSLDKLVSTASGGKWDSLNSMLDDKIIPSIDKLKDSAVAWIEANPERITEFFQSLKGIDWKGLLRGFAEGVGDIADSIKKMADVASGANLSWLGKLFAKSGAFGWFFTVLGGLLKGTRHLWAGLGTAGTALLRHFTAGKSDGGIFGSILSIFGKKESLEAAGDVAKSVPTVADTFKGAFNALKGVMVAAGAVTLVSASGFVAFKAVKSMIKDLKEIGDVLKGMTWLDAVHGVNIVAGIGVFAEIFSAFGNALGPKGLLGVAIATAASFLVTGGFAGNMRLIKDGVKSIKETILEFDNVASAIENMKGIDSISDDTRNKFRNTIDAINEIRQMFIGKNGAPIYQGEVEAGLRGFGKGKVDTLTNIAEAVKQMQSIVRHFNKLAELSLSDPSQIIEDIKAACDKLQGIRGPKDIEKHTEAVAEALIQIRRMAYHINKLAGTEVNVGGFAAFVQQIKSALAEFKELSGELMLDIEVKLSPLFGSSVESVKKNIKEAKKDIERLKSPVKFTIPVSVTFSVTSNFYSALAEILRQREALKDSAGGSSTYRAVTGNGATRAMGGLIYRSGGGGVPWKRRGTDTVPAMLTPGEYVHNRRAVDMFGIDFMRKVNNLDMKGAMNELMHRAGHMANINRGTTITNNNYNNQKVIINNSNAGAGYTFRTASRFVGAF